MSAAKIVDMDGRPITRSTHPQFYNGGLGNGAASLDNNSLQGWNWWGGSADDDITAHLDVVRQRCRDLSLNAPVVAGMINTIVTNVVGRGLIPEPTPDKESLGLSLDEAAKLKKDILRHWEEFAESTECDVRRRDNFYELQALVHRSVLESGDIFAALPYVNFPGSKSLLDLRIQLIEADCVSNPSIASKYNPDANIFGGVEVGEYGEIIAFHIATRHPLSHRKFNVAKTEWVRVPAIGDKTGRQNILHIMRSLRPGQRRGVPMLAPVVEAVKVLDRYIKAELQAALVQSLFTAVIKTQVPEAAIGEWAAMMSDQVGLSDNNDAQNAREQFYQRHGMLEMGSGTIGFMAPGDDIVPVGVTRPASGFSAFTEAQLRFIGSALGLPFEMVVMMFSSSFSASRAAINMATAGFKEQRDRLTYDFCQPVYEEFMANIVAKGYIKAPDFFTNPLKRRAYCLAKWSGPGDLQIDPMKEAQSYERAIGLGAMSYSEVAAKYGNDYYQTAEALYEEQTVWDEKPWDRTPLRVTRAAPAQAAMEGGNSDAAEAEATD